MNIPITMRYINQATTYIIRVKIPVAGAQLRTIHAYCIYVFKNIATDTIRLRMSENIIKLINTWVYLRVSTI